MKKIVSLTVFLALLWFASAMPAQAQMNVCASQSLSVTGTSGNVQINTSCTGTGMNVMIWNVGSAETFVTFGVDNSATATVLNRSIPPGSFKVFPLPTATRWIAGITATGTSTLRIDTGTNPVIAGGGGGGGGGSGGSNASVGLTGVLAPGSATLGGMVVSGNLIGFTGTGSNLNVQCANCSGSGASAVDTTTFTPASSVLAPNGGFFQTTATNNPLGNLQQGMQQMTAQRAGFVNLRNASGAELGIAAAPLQVSLANTGANTNKLLVTPDSVALPANQSVNVSQINGVTPLVGNGVTGTGSQRVTIASDNTAFSVNATLSAETTKVIGVVRNADGAGNLLTSTVNALDINIKSGSIANTSFAATQATASALNATVVGTGTFAVQAAQSGAWNITNVSGTVSLPTGASTAAKQPALGTAGSASTDVLSVQGIASMTPLLANPGTAANWGVGTSTQNSATVANGQLALGQFNTTPTTITTGNMSPLQLDNAGKLLVNCTGCSSSGSITSWGGGTLGAMANYGTSPGAVLVPGVNAFVTNSNTNGSATSANSSPVVVASDQVAIAVKGNAASGSAVSGNPNLIAGSDGTNARTIATDTAGNQKVINGGSNYETIAASQTAQVMGGAGATGDYLSHCVIYPATTSPGVVTVFDNANAAATNVIAFAGGATSTSNLTPISVPVGAVSTAGAWKVTTGANVSAVCYGKFT